MFEEIDKNHLYQKYISKQEDEAMRSVRQSIYLQLAGCGLRPIQYNHLLASGFTVDPL